MTPCGECDSCRGIANAASLDVIEMDAASNNSVDDIRDLREKVAYAPVSGHHKVYILDEAHMLTTAAWNAFLKTLEEPPPNTIFVLATTEANKVLPTVVDRCHRFDFSRPSVPQISAVLKRVAERESISIPDEATALIARSATGSFRDALGTLEQLLAYSGNEIALEDVLAVLGAADADLVFGAVDAIAAGQQREALLAAARLAESGRDLGRFFSDLEAHARGLMVVQTLGEVPAELRITPGAGRAAGRAGAPRRAGDRRAAAGADRRRAARDEGRRRRPHAARAGAAEGRRARLRPDRQGAAGADRAARERPAGRRRRPPPPAPTPRAPSEPATAAGRTAVAVTAQVEGQPPVAAATTLPGAAADGQEQATRARRAGRRGRLRRARDGGRSGPRGRRRRGRRARRARRPSRASPPASSSRPRRSPSSGPPCSRASARRRRCSPPCSTGARPAGLDDGELTLAWPESAGFFKRKAEDPASKETIARVIRAVTGSSLRLAYELRDDAALAAGPAAAPQLTEEELVNRFVEEFDAEVLPPEEEST